MRVLVLIKSINEDLSNNINENIMNADDFFDNISKKQRRINPFDENALEAAINLKEKKIAKEIWAFSIDDNNEILINALAMGADKAFWLNEKIHESLQKAKIIAQFVKKNQIEIVILGTKSFDYASNQVPAMIATILDFTLANNIIKIDFDNQEFSLISQRDENHICIKAKKNIVISCDDNLNKPRYVSVLNLIKAKNKPLLEVSLKDLELNKQNSKQHIINFKRNSRNKTPQELKTVQELANLMNKIIR